MQLRHENEMFVLNCTYQEYRAHSIKVKGARFRWDKLNKRWHTDSPANAACLIEFADEPTRQLLAPHAKERQAKHARTIQKGGKRRSKPHSSSFVEGPDQNSAWDDNVLVCHYLESGLAVDLSNAKRVPDGGYLVENYQTEATYCADGKWISSIRRCDGQTIAYLDLTGWRNEEGIYEDCVYVRI